MAVISNQFKPKDEQDDQSGSENTAPASAPVSVTGVGDAAPATTSGGTVSGAQTPSKSGAFTNITNYLQANANYNKSGGGLAGQITGNIQKSADATKQGLDQAQNQFNNGYSQNVGNFSGAVDNGPAPVGGPGTTQSTTPSTLPQADVAPAPPKLASTYQNVIDDPTHASADATAAFMKARDAQYTGPTSLDVNGKLKADATNVKNLADQSGTESGRFSLLKNMFNNGNYSGGQQKLDNLLLQSNPNQVNKLQSLRPVANGLVNNLNTAQNSIAGQVSDAQRLATQAQQLSRDALQKGVTDFASGDNSVLGQRLADYKLKLAGQQASEQKDFSNGKLTPEELAASGLTDGDKTFGLDLNGTDENGNSFFNKTDPSFNLQNVANSDDYDRIAALSRLSGGLGNSTIDNSLKQYVDPTQAGIANSILTDPSKQFSFDKERFDSAVSGKKADYETELAPIKQQFDNANISMQSSKNLIASLPSIDELALKSQPIHTNGNTFMTPETLKAQQQLVQLRNAQENIKSQLAAIPTMQAAIDNIGKKHHISDTVGRSSSDRINTTTDPSQLIKLGALGNLAGRI